MECCVQEYIRSPLLIRGAKVRKNGVSSLRALKNGLFFSQFDIRIYVLITGLDPLKIYMYDDGLVRIATEDYTEDPSFISDSCIHVCNYDVNHQSEKFINNTHESSRDGHKVLF